MIPTYLRRHAPTSALLAATLVASACSPVFNWREASLGGDALLVALLPCKPDRAQRELPLGDSGKIVVSMMGCEAGGATFAIAHASAPDAARAQAWMGTWRSQARAQWADGHVDEREATVNHASALPPPMRMDADRSAPAPVPHATQLWFAHNQRNGTVSIYQATVLGNPSSPEAVQTFLEGLHLP